MYISYNLAYYFEHGGCLKIKIITSFMKLPFSFKKMHIKQYMNYILSYESPEKWINMACLGVLVLNSAFGGVRDS